MMPVNKTVSELTVTDCGQGKSVQASSSEETNYLLKNPGNVAHLERSIEQYQSGKTISSELKGRA